MGKQQNQKKKYIYFLTQVNLAPSSLFPVPYSNRELGVILAPYSQLPVPYSNRELRVILAPYSQHPVPYSNKYIVWLYILSELVPKNSKTHMKVLFHHFKTFGVKIGNPIRNSRPQASTVF